MTRINPFCCSSYLAFRYVTDPSQSWIEGVRPIFPHIDVSMQTEVETADEIVRALRNTISQIAGSGEIGIFLSSGIDSAILAALLPKTTRAYTIDFDAPGFPRESARAALYARANNLKHKAVRVTWADYLESEQRLMMHKKSPLHPVEPALYKASLIAREDGVERVVIGNGADSTFGGLDKLLSKDWTFDEFVNRYTFVQPREVLKEAADVLHIYEPYRKEHQYIDVQMFLKIVHGYGIIQAFNNAIGLAGLEILQPYEHLKLKGSLDIERIRNGNPKYLLKEVFHTLYPDLTAPPKVAFARPMNSWLEMYSGPQSDLFRTDININRYTGEQKFIIRCLDQFIQCLREGKL